MSACEGFNVPSKSCFLALVMNECNALRFLDIQHYPFLSQMKNEKRPRQREC